MENRTVNVLVVSRRVIVFLRCFAALAISFCLALSSQAQTFSVLYNFTGSSDGGDPYSGLVLDQKGNLYGTAFTGGVGAGVVFEIVHASGTEKVLHTFLGAPTDGASPTNPLLLTKKGLYGTTNAGGENGYGTIYLLNPSGESVVYSFVGGNADGCFPGAGLIQDSTGNLYGTTSEGGAAAFDGSCPTSGALDSPGTIFTLDAQGKESLLHSFTGSSDVTTDGAYPTWGSLLMDKSGDLYGVTQYGGANRVCQISNPPHGCFEWSIGEGTLYELSKEGKFTLLHSFGSSTGEGFDGFPMGTPIMDAEGNIYGTSYGCNPGACNPVGAGQGWGAVWEWTNTGTYKVLYYFNPDEGVFPIGGLTIDKEGNLYGTTEGAGQGAYPNGTVFELSKSLSLTVLHGFSGTDGAYPVGALTGGSSGNLYGTTYQGGAYGNGTVFEITLPPTLR